MAVQGKGDSVVCDRCFAMVKSGSEFCSECGAPVGSAPAEGSDSAIYPELARANLLRMRGEYKSAIDQCRTILRKFPNNVTANQLLGDLCVESGDLPQAKEWYELALDIAPNHVQVQKKLLDVRKQLEKDETQGLVEQIGLPPTKSRNGLWASLLALLVIGVGIIAYILGTQKPVAERTGAPKQTSFTAPIVRAEPEPTQPPAPTSAAPVNPGSAEENSLLQLIVQRSTNGGRIIGLTTDPRTSVTSITFRIEPADEPRLIASEIAAITLENSPQTRLVTLRGLAGTTLSYMADVRRETYEETKLETWRQANGSDPAIIAGHVISQEWPSPTPSEPPAETAGSTAGL